MANTFKFTVDENVKINVTPPPTEDYEIVEVESTAKTRGVKSKEQILIEENHLAELELEDGSVWIGHALELPEFIGVLPKESSIRGGKEVEIRIPSRIRVVEDEQRGIGRWLRVQALSFFRKKVVNKVAEEVVKIAALKLDKHIQPKPGFYAVNNDFTLREITEQLAHSNQPILVFLHGTANSFKGSFGDVKTSESKRLWELITSRYSGRMYALEHYTLTKNPIENALDLMAFLPDNATVHLISQSRGGLVGDVLSLFHSSNMQRGIPEVELNLLRKIDGFESSVDQLEKLLQQKQITVEQFVRVACPASGTSLCSDSLDRFFNILLNSVGFLIPATKGVVEVVKEVLMAILECKDETHVIPGIAVMAPDSVYTKVMNSPSIRVDAPLTVVCGANKFGWSWKVIVTLIAKAVFKHENDWIVDTSSMSGGVRRNESIRRYKYSDDDLNHFSYFSLSATQNAVADALNFTSGLPIYFEHVNQSLENSQRGRVTGNYQTPPVTGNRPVVILLPGILGSNLAVQENDELKEIYLDIDQIMLGGMKKLSIDNPNVKPTSVIGMFYKEFGDYLNQTNDVSVFPFDWRLSIADEAKRLAEEVKQILKNVPNQPIRITAHSMGGLVVRHFMLKYPDVWNELKSRDGFRLIFMGSPLGGSYLVPEVFVGLGERINQMAMLDITSSKESLLNIFVNYKGLLNLMPISEVPYDFTKEETWNELKENWDKIDWPKPDVNVFKAFKDELLTFDEAEFSNPNILYIAGKAPETVDNYYFKLNRRKGRRLEFTTTPQGDGSVTWSSGIPKQMGKNQVYYVNVGHGKLMDEKSIFDGVRELLEKGTTSQFSHSPIVDVENKGLWSRLTGRTALRANNNEELARALFGVHEYHPLESSYTANPIHVSLYCSDLTYAKHALLMVHLDSEALYGTEIVVDRLFKGALTNRINLGIFPRQLGESAIIPDHKGQRTLIIAGLGSAAKISGTTVIKTLSSAIMKYALQQIEQQKPKGNDKLKLKLSSLLLGSNYIGLSVYQAIECVIEAIDKANQQLVNSNLPAVFVALEFLEIYEDKACQAFLELKKLCEHKSKLLRFDQDSLIHHEGYRERYVQEDHAGWWNRLQVTMDRGLESYTGKETVVDLEYTFSEGLARAKRELVSMSVDTLRPIFEHMSSKHEWSEEVAQALYNRLIPHDFRGDFKNQQNILLTLDEFTAEFPWELIQDHENTSVPYVTKVGFIRQLSTNTYRANVEYARNKQVLIIGDPNLEGWELFGQLQGANKEAHAINDMFVNQGYKATPVIYKLGFDTSVKFHAGSYQIIHYAGHGHFNPENSHESGLVIGKNTYLRPNDIKAMSAIPELVFINACYAGQMLASAEKQAVNRYRLSANIGSELIRIGVKAVVVAAWAVDDSLAKLFAETFYQSMFAGKTFSEAIQDARRSVYEMNKDSNTWGAYQAYGDEHYTLKAQSKSFSKPDSDDRYDLRQFMDVELRNLLRMKEFSMNKEAKLSRLEALEKKMWEWPEKHTSTLELFALNYEKLRSEENALRMFAHMRKAADGQFSVKSLEIELKLRRKKIQNAPIDEQALLEIGKIIQDLKSLLAVYKTSERYSLIGGTYKTFAKILIDFANQKGETQFNEETKNKVLDALKSASENYLLAMKAAPEQSTQGVYPYINRIVIDRVSDLIENGKRRKFNKKDQQQMDELEAVFNSMRVTHGNPKNYWDKMLECNFLFAKYLFTLNSKDLEVFKEKLSDIWEIDGSVDDKKIEVEHIEAIYTLIKGVPQAESLKALIEWMKSKIQ